MKIVFSRKGFDTASGGGPSPIVDEVPLSLPIPAGAGPSATTYGSLGLGDQAREASRGRFGASDPCHHDPMFLPEGICHFGQCGAAQTHLANEGVGVGDIFLFFGLFRASGEKPHHRIFGYLEVGQVLAIAECGTSERQRLCELGHPHAIEMLGRNDTIYSGPGSVARNSAPQLRLTVPEGPPSVWSVPQWLRDSGLSYHGRADRWLERGRLRSVSRGQEFVADIGDRQEARQWAASVISAIRGATAT